MNGRIPPTAAQCLGFAAILAACAFLLPGTPSAFAEGSQNGSGSTSLVLHLAYSGEFTGTTGIDDPLNPDWDGDGIGDNLSFTVPTRIDFNASANGTLTGPSPDLVYLENESMYTVHVSSMQISERGEWKIVRDAMSSSLSNSIDLSIGPEADVLNAVDYLYKAGVTEPSEWNMGPKTDTGDSDRVKLTTSGHLRNVQLDLASAADFGQICWYVTPGVAV